MHVLKTEHKTNTVPILLCIPASRKGRYTGPVSHKKEIKSGEETMHVPERDHFLNYPIENFFKLPKSNKPHQTSIDRLHNE